MPALAGRRSGGGRGILGTGGVGVENGKRCRLGRKFRSESAKTTAEQHIWVFAWNSSKLGVLNLVLVLVFPSLSSGSFYFIFDRLYSSLFYFFSAILYDLILLAILR